MIDKDDVLDGTVVKMPKTYPAYFGTYNSFDKVKDFTNSFANLFLIGRNGMHKYNNQDHSMLTAMKAVENIKNGVLSKENIWDINTEMEYHEEK
jgi:protoporphyrinogen oxidase